MPRRWIVPWKDSQVKPVMYHCLSRVVDKRMAFGPDEKEKFRTLMRMTETFSGCRVLTYCVMSNHFHLLLEIPPMPSAGISDEELLRRLQGLYSEAIVSDVARELAEARQQVADGLAQESVVVARVHERFTHRMHDLSEFMKTLIQRFTLWFNRSHQRSGNLWEDAFKSVVVEDGMAARTMAAYIDLNPVRARICVDPADYRWSGYGEAMGGGRSGGGQKARAGLVRAWLAHEGISADTRLWSKQVAQPYRTALLESTVEKTVENDTPQGDSVRNSLDKERNRTAPTAELGPLKSSSELALGGMLRCRIRYFTDGLVIGSREFVNEFFQGTRERFGPKRKDGARKLRGAASVVAERLWTLRDLQKS